MLPIPVRVLADHGPVRVELARWRDRLVVVKSLRAESAPMAARLQREAMVLQKLQHEHIVPLLAAEGSRLIYAYCPGVPLSEVLEAGALPLRRSIKIIGDVLKALDYAHSQGVIHFDVKPANILIEGQQARLSDFGFAKDLGMTAITGQGMFFGTPNYMAPEQFRGERSDPRSDLYAAGAVLYHMLTGAPPYGPQVVRFLVGDKRLKLAPLPAVAAPLAGVLSTTLSRSPEARYDSAASMLSAINHAFENSWF
jgi:serine/threonine-protein kinase